METRDLRFYCVDLVRAYSNRSDLADDLTMALVVKLAVNRGNGVAVTPNARAAWTGGFSLPHGGPGDVLARIIAGALKLGCGSSRGRVWGALTWGFVRVLIV
jgi:hypothetical protein